MKHIKAAVTVFVVTLLVVSGAAFIFGGGSAAFAGGFAATTLFNVEILAIAAMSAVSTLVGGLLTRDVDGVSQNFGAKVAGRTPTTPRPIIYGECRVGGTITHIETSGTDNHKMRLIIALAGHEIESLERVYFNDTELTFASVGNFSHVTNSKYVNTDNDNAFASGRLVRMKFKNGSQTTADSDVISNTSLGNTDKFIGVAYVFIEMIFDSEAFGGGIPSFAFRVKGKKVYDPRDGSQSATDPTTWTWSDNPALHVRDYLQDTLYGMKATQDELNDTTDLGGFSAAANTCDSSSTVGTAVTSSATNNSTLVQIALGSNNTRIGVGMRVTGTGISGVVKVRDRRGVNITLDTAVTVGSGVTLTFGEVAYTSDGITDFSATGEAVISGLLSACAGKLSYVNGKFVMFAGASVTPEMTITDENLLAPVQVQTSNGRGESYNTVKALYVDSSNRYTASDTPTYTDTALLNADTPTGESTANYRKTLEIQLPFTTTSTMAQRIAKSQLLHQRQEVALSALVNIGFMQLQPFDHVYLTNERLGFTQKRFEVLGQKLETIDSQEEGEGGTVLATRLDLKEIDPAVYNFLQSDYEDITEEDGDDDDTGDRSVTAPTGLALTQRTEIDGTTVKADIEVSWTNNSDDLVMGTEVAYKLSTDSNYEGHLLAGKGETKALIPNVVVGKTYNVKVRHFAQTNVYSDYTSAVNLAISDPTSISAPSSFTATSNKIGIQLEWTNPTNTNLRAIKIYRKTVDSTPSTNDAQLIATMTGEPNRKMVFHQGSMDGLSAGTTYFFWLRAITHSGTHSDFTDSVSGSFTFLDKFDIGLNNVTNDTQVKSDGSNAPNILKNDQISISKSGGAIRLSNTGSDTDITLLKGDVGLGNVLNAEQVREDLANAPNEIKNNQIQLAKDGSGNLSLSNAGSGNVSFDKGDVGLGNLINAEQVKLDLSNAPNAIKNAEIVDADIIGSGKVFGAGNKPNKTVLNGNNLELDGNNAGAVKNSGISLNLTGQSLSLTGGGGSAQSFDKGSVGLSDLDSLEAGTGTKLSGIESGATVGAQAGTNLKDSGGSSLGDEDVRNSDLSVDFTGNTTFRIKKGSTVIDTQAFDKGNVGLSDLASLDSAQNSKLTGIEASATVGARAGVNLKRNNNTVVGDADIITSEGTSDDTENVNSVAKTDITGSITGTQTNVASVIQNLAAGTQPINAGALNAGEINTSLLKLDELFLPTTGTDASGTLVLFGSSMTQVSLGDIGTGAGFYMGTISVEIDDSNNDDIRGASLHIDLKSGFSTVYTKYWPIGQKEGNRYYDHTDQFGDNNDLPVMHLEFGFFHNSTNTLSLFVNGDSNDNGTHCNIKARVVKFGAETVAFNTSSFTSAITGATASSTQSSGNITVSGFTLAKSVNLSGDSSAKVSVNGGTFQSANVAQTITSGQTLQLQMTASATAGTTRSCTVEVGGTSATFTVTTTGTYTPQYSGGGGSGGAGGGFETQTQLN